MIYLVYLIQALVYLLKLTILARALISWMRTDPYNPWVRFLYQVTEPLLRPLRQALPSWGGIDLSPIVALVLIELVEWFLTRVLQ
ncbi:MAG: YggT family protein [Chloroflexota bacterium]|nr:YggT family protein [Chloroflexota bacterium]